MRWKVSVLLLLLPLIPSFADSGMGQWPLGGTAGVTEPEEHGVRLVKEEVVVTINHDDTYYYYYAEVKADFELHNPGPAREVVLFLPLESSIGHKSSTFYMVDESADEPDLSEKIVESTGLEMRLGWQRLEPEFYFFTEYEEEGLAEGALPFLPYGSEPVAGWSAESPFIAGLESAMDWHDLKLDLWALFEAVVPEGTSRLSYSYRMWPGVSLEQYGCDFSYPLWSGGSWSGNIGSGTVEYHLAEGIDPNLLLPHEPPEGVGLERTVWGVRFLFEDWKASGDASVIVIVCPVFTVDELYTEPGGENPLSGRGEWWGDSMSLDALDVLELREGWARVSLEDGDRHLEGWTTARNDNWDGLWAARDYPLPRVIWPGGLNFRTAPSSEAPRVPECPRLDEGAYLYLIRVEGDWLKALVMDDEGWHLGWARWYYSDPESGESRLYVAP